MGEVRQLHGPAETEFNNTCEIYAESRACRQHDEKMKRAGARRARGRIRLPIIFGKLVDSLSKAPFKLH
jgi:hypothetical protein